MSKVVFLMKIGKKYAAQPDKCEWELEEIPRPDHETLTHSLLLAVPEQPPFLKEMKCVQWALIRGLEWPEIHNGGDNARKSLKY
jgi:hypothetical protein